MISFTLTYGPVILKGLWATAQLVTVGFSAGIILGLLIVPLRTAKVRLVRFMAVTYVEIIRNTPFLIQASLLFAVFGVFHIRLSPSLLGTVSIALYTAAYSSEIVRGALQSVSSGQWDASKALGLGRLKTFRLVIFPQLMPFALPAGTNLLATVTKESSFLSALSVAELTFYGQMTIAKTYAVFEVWAIVAALYLIVILSILQISSRLERSYQWARR